jgi:hypothetical protein
MRHATALLYHVCAVASRNISFASCGTSGKLSLWTRYIISMDITTHHLNISEQFTVTYVCLFLVYLTICLIIQDSSLKAIRILAGTPPVLTNICCGFPQSFQANGGRIPRLGHNCFFSNSSHPSVISHRTVRYCIVFILKVWKRKRLLMSVFLVSCYISYLESSTAVAFNLGYVYLWGYMKTS